MYGSITDARYVRRIYMFYGRGIDDGYSFKGFVHLCIDNIVYGKDLAFPRFRHIVKYCYY